MWVHNISFLVFTGLNKTQLSKENISTCLMTPSVSLQDTSPYELLFQSVPDYSVLRVFGCLAYASTIPAHRHKFSPRATPCVFMGYPPVSRVTGYLILFLDLDSSNFFSPTVIPQPSSDPSPSDEPIPVPLPEPIHDPVPNPLPDPLPGALPSIPQAPPAPVLRRSSRPSKPPAHLDLYDCNSVPHPIQSFLTYDHISPSYMTYISQVSSFYEPQFYHQAIQYPEWRQAMAAELVALESNNTWTVMPLPAGKRAIGCKWVYKVKCNVDGSKMCLNIGGQGLLFPANSSDRLTSYVDADWDSCQVTRRSTTGFCIYLGDSLITWKSKKQATVARSSAEAEYRALASVTTKLLWMKQLLSDFGISVPSVKVLCDSKSAIQLAHNPTTQERTKHIDIDRHFLRQHVQSGFLNLIHVKSNQQLADCLTKPLAKVQFRELMSKLGILNIYLPT
ncbi:copia protein [Trifolium medium]|uniref:Copia protein n=1 Tax=Trifolium medium TaxID=97028 RepID=A0A392M0Y0_9FABA|nr:copia protein [Trifolium medium]